MGEAGDKSSLNGLFKRDSRLHSFVAFWNDIVFTLSYLIVILKGEARASWGSLNTLSKRDFDSLLPQSRKWRSSVSRSIAFHKRKRPPNGGRLIKY